MHELPRLAVTVGAFFALLVVFLAVHFLATPRTREFSLLDASIGYTAVEQQLCSSTCLYIVWVLELALLFGTLIAMLTLEYLYNKTRARPKRLVRYNGSFSAIQPQQRARTRAIWGGFLIVCGFMGALAFTAMLAEITKNAVGFPRPQFLWVCDVYEYQAWRAANSSAARALTEYQRRLDASDLWHETEDFLEHCSVDDVRSFVSGHSASSFCCASYVFLFFFLHVRPKLGQFINAKKRRIRRFAVAMRAVAAVLGFVSVAAAGWVTFTRVIDAKHSPADVTGGVLLGLVGGLVGYLVAFGGYSKPQDKEE